MPNKRKNLANQKPTKITDHLPVWKKINWHAKKISPPKQKKLGSQRYRRMFKNLNFIYMSIHSQIWLNAPIVDRHFGYIIKLTTKKKSTLAHEPNQTHSSTWTVFLFFPNLWSNWVADHAQEELAKMARCQKWK